MYFISRLQYFLLIFLSLFCASFYWKYNIGVDVFFYDLLQITFIVVSVIRILANNGKFNFYDKRLRVFFILLSLVFFVKIISFIGLHSSGFSQESLIQFSVEFTTEFVFLLFSLCLIQYLGTVTNSDRYLFVQYFILGGILSSIYGVVHIYLLTNYNLNVDNYIWNIVSSSHKTGMDKFLNYSMNGVLRGKGFAGQNASATYYVAIIPLVATLALSSVGIKRVGFIMYSVLLVTGELLIMSRTGVIAFILSLVLLFFLLKKIKALFYILVLTVVITLLFINNIDTDTITEIIYHRVNLSTDRYLLYEGAMQIFSEQPVFGVGLNNYSQYALSENNILLHDENLHSSWLNILVETGFFGVISYIMIFLYVIKMSYNKSSFYSKAFIAAIISLMLAGLFNTLFTIFYFKFFLVLMFSVVILSDEKNNIYKSYQ